VLRLPCPARSPWFWEHWPPLSIWTERWHISFQSPSQYHAKPPDMACFGPTCLRLFIFLFYILLHSHGKQVAWASAIPFAGICDIFWLGLLFLEASRMDSRGCHPGRSPGLPG
jgi:hypothetical protein